MSKDHVKKSVKKGGNTKRKLGNTGFGSLGLFNDTSFSDAMRPYLESILTNESLSCAERNTICYSLSSQYMDMCKLTTMAGKKHYAKCITELIENPLVFISKSDSINVHIAQNAKKMRFRGLDQDKVYKLIAKKLDEVVQAKVYDVFNMIDKLTFSPISIKHKITYERFLEFYRIILKHRNPNLPLTIEIKEFKTKSRSLFNTDISGVPKLHELFHNIPQQQNLQLLSINNNGIFHALYLMSMETSEKFQSYDIRGVNKMVVPDNLEVPLFDAIFIDRDSDTIPTIKLSDVAFPQQTPMVHLHPYKLLKGLNDYLLTSGNYHQQIYFHHLELHNCFFVPDSDDSNYGQSTKQTKLNIDSMLPYEASLTPNALQIYNVSSNEDNNKIPPQSIKGLENMDNLKLLDVHNTHVHIRDIFSQCVINSNNSKKLKYMIVDRQQLKKIFEDTQNTQQTYEAFITANNIKGICSVSSKKYVEHRPSTNGKDSLYVNYDIAIQEFLKNNIKMIDNFPKSYNSYYMICFN